MKKNTNKKIYKHKVCNNNSMLPGDRNGSPDESFFNGTLVFIDEGFLSKLSKHLGKGKYLKFDKIHFSRELANKQKLSCKKIFYYLAPPFQCEPPTKEEELLREGHDRFVKKLRKRGIVVREGRCQRLKIDNKFKYNQKAVDILLAMDLVLTPLKYPKIKRIILIACDSDFVPVIQSLMEFGVKTILYTYYEKKRNTKFKKIIYQEEICENIYINKTIIENQTTQIQIGTENESQVSVGMLLGDIIKSVQEIFNWNTEQDNRIKLLEDELCLMGRTAFCEIVK